MYELSCLGLIGYYFGCCSLKLIETDDLSHLYPALLPDKVLLWGVYTPPPTHTHTHSSNKNYILAARSSSTDPGEVSDKGLPTNRQIHSSSTDSDNE